MKHKNSRKGETVTEPLLRDLTAQQKKEQKRQQVSVGLEPLPSPDLYQDAGGGYNADLTFPQE